MKLPRITDEDWRQHNRSPRWNGPSPIITKWQERPWPVDAETNSTTRAPRPLDAPHALSRSRDAANDLQFSRPVAVMHRLRTLSAHILGTVTICRNLDDGQPLILRLASARNRS
jgi:hypothetical protein